MLAEEIKLILSAAAIDFMEGAGHTREVFLYEDDVVADGVPPLAKGTAIKVTFEYVEIPKIGEIFGV